MQPSLCQPSCLVYISLQPLTKLSELLLDRTTVDGERVGVDSSLDCKTYGE